MKDEKRVKIRFIILICLIAFFVLLSFIMRFLGYDFYDEMKGLANTRYGVFAFISLFAISAFFPIPLLTFFGATLYGFWEVFAYSIIGNMLNATIVFLVVRFFGRGYVQVFESRHERIKKIDIEFKKHGFRDIILMRFFFLIPPELVNLSGGLSGMKFRNYFMASLIGNIPVSLASIMLIQGKLQNDYVLLLSSILMFAVMFVIPLFYVASIRAFSKRKYEQAKKFWK